jgi:hypothetical protein
LVLKLVLTPALIAAASLAGRRWGPTVSGWLVGLPLTSGPVVFFLALEHGTSFAAAAAVGTLAGTISQAAFCVVYARIALHGAWPLALLGGCAGFLAVTAGLIRVNLPTAFVFALALAALVVALSLMPGPRSGAVTPGPDSAPAAASAPPRWDLPARMVVATAFVLLLTGVSAALGAHVTGLLAPFPVYASVLAVFAQRQRGPAAAASVLRGLVYGLFSFAGFMLTLAELLARVGTAGAFAAALVVALALQGLSLWVIRRAAATPPPQSRRQKDQRPVPSQPPRPAGPRA